MRVRRELGDLATLPPYWGNDGKTRRVMTLTCETELNIKIAQEMSRRLQEASLGVPKFNRKPGYDAFSEGRYAISLERMK